ncbi:hypothetical protein [Fuerstiella marisgermanici]|uniref:Uncharacterized protein n=1 Tax=Fuerstiella marisgermanici TaxID=1891926 RepID=A0A1P8WHL2_9PLAN|nr:hypothetical protein [Fuerstiella marisgermanici]APZ93523.1 hypothetical protein Fuma_03141 [Fuerstiella marisgermanici]
MSRFSWLAVAFAFLTVVGCGGPGSIDAPDEAEVKDKTPIEEDMEAAGMGEMTTEEYLSGGKKQ